MSPARPQKPTHLNDDALLARLVELNGAHRLSLTSLLEHIAEVDVRRLFAQRGHSSMHRYCVRELNMSDDGAYARIRVARLGRRLPTVLAQLADGRLHLTAARLLASHLTPENHRAVLTEASGLNVAGIKRLVARLAPKPDVPTRVRALPARRTEPRPTSGQAAKPRSACETPRPPSAPAALGGPRSPSARPPSPEEPRPQVAPPLTLEAPRPIVAPLAPERFEVRFTASADLIEKLTEVTALLSHAVPDGDLPTVLERALDLARTQLVKRRYGAGALAERTGATGGASAGAAPMTDEVVEGQPKGRAQTAPRSTERRPRASSPGEAPAGRASASRSATRRDGGARSRTSGPAEAPAGRASASRSATRRDGEPRSRASSPAEAPAERTSALPRPCPSTASRHAGGAEQLVSKPAPTHEMPVERSRYIPAAVRAEVWRRDEGRCTYVDPDTGHACGARRFLELHHIQPFARGGAHTVEVLTLRCRAHNAWAARVDFGADVIDACIARS